MSALHFGFDHSYARDVPAGFRPGQPARAPAPQLVFLNRPLARELGLDPAAWTDTLAADVFSGNRLPEDARPIAQAYAGHQFGGFSPQLGDGRALLLGELIDRQGRRRDLAFKGSGRTPFSRGGDGKAALGPMLREVLIGEALQALGVPTTRALAVVATGEAVRRDRPLPGAVLTRVAASHLRVGSLQYFAARGEADSLARLVDHAVARHDPELATEPDRAARALGLLLAVARRQAALLAQWMNLGFIHGVMNTDNMSLSGESIDFGPCAFMDAYDPATVFSSIDHGGRYAYGNQPRIAMWNLARFAEAILGLIDDEDDDVAIEKASAVLQSFSDRFEGYWDAGMRAKLGLVDAPVADDAVDAALVVDLLALMQADRVDWTGFFRALSAAVRGDAGPARAYFADPTGFDAWAGRWEAARARTGADPAATADAMDRVNPVYVPRNHLVEAALTAATAGDLGPVRELVAVVSDPFTERPGLEAYAAPAPEDFGRYVTFCGT